MTKPAQTRLLVCGDVTPHGRRQVRRMLASQSGALQLVHRERGKRVWADAQRLVVVAVSAHGDAS